MAGRVPLPLNSEGRESLRTILLNHGVIAHPTETVYGFAAIADEAGQSALARFKERPASQPFLMLVPGLGFLDSDWVRCDDRVREFLASAWPGALTVVLDPGPAVPPSLVGPEGGVAVRHSPHPLVRELLELVGSPLLSTSANRGGFPTRVGPVPEEWPGTPSVWVDGDSWGQAPSTLVDCRVWPWKLLRRGPVEVAEVAPTD